MAKRKAAPATRRKTAGRRGSGVRAGVKKAAARKDAAGRRKGQPAKRTSKSATNAVRQRTGATARQAAKRAGSARGTARKGSPATSRSAPARKSAAAARKTPAARKPAALTRKTPALNRERRIVRDDEDIVQSTPPSSLDLDRSASAARSGRRSLRERYKEHTETGPALTGGDVDADWESAYSVGDEAPGGDNPTPDQDLVDDIGRAVGIEYQDNEELKGADKVEKRDKKRWELDPASSEDWDER